MHPKKHQHRHHKIHRGYAVSGRTGYGVGGYPWYAMYMGGGGTVPDNEEREEGNQGGQENDNDAGTSGNSGSSSGDGGGAGAGSV